MRLWVKDLRGSGTAWNVGKAGQGNLDSDSVISISLPIHGCPLFGGRLYLEPPCYCSPLRPRSPHRRSVEEVFLVKMPKLSFQGTICGVFRKRRPMTAGVHNAAVSFSGSTIASIDCFWPPIIRISFGPTCPCHSTRATALICA